MKDLKDKVAVITGAGSGIGRALALRLAQEGMALALSDFNCTTLEATLALLPAGHRARGYPVDVASREAVFAHAEEVRRDFGAVHLVVNNAGATIVGTVEHLSIEEIEWQLNVNLWSVIYGTKAFLPGLLARREGCIVNLASVFSFVSLPAQGAYCISKFGVRALNECLWRELAGTGVNLISVHPCGIQTNVATVARHAARAGAFEAGIWATANSVLRTPPEVVATAIVDGIRRGRKRVVVGRGSSTLFWVSRIFPDRYHAVLRWLGL